MAQFKTKEYSEAVRILLKKGYSVEQISKASPQWDKSAIEHEANAIGIKQPDTSWTSNFNKPKDSALDPYGQTAAIDKATKPKAKKLSRKPTVSEDLQQASKDDQNKVIKTPKPLKIAREDAVTKAARNADIMPVVDPADALPKSNSQLLEEAYNSFENREKQKFDAYDNTIRTITDPINKAVGAVGSAIGQLGADIVANDFVPKITPMGVVSAADPSSPSYQDWIKKQAAKPKNVIHSNPETEGIVERTVRNAGGLLPYVVPYAGQVAMAAQVPDLLSENQETGEVGAVTMAKDVINRFRDPVTAVKRGELPNMVFDVAMILHGGKAVLGGKKGLRFKTPKEALKFEEGIKTNNPEAVVEALRDTKEASILNERQFNAKADQIRAKMALESQVKQAQVEPRPVDTNQIKANVVQNLVEEGYVKPEVAAKVMQDVGVKEPWQEPVPQIRQLENIFDEQGRKQLIGGNLKSGELEIIQDKIFDQIEAIEAQLDQIGERPTDNKLADIYDTLTNKVKSLYNDSELVSSEQTRLRVASRKLDRKGLEKFGKPAEDVRIQEVLDNAFADYPDLAAKYGVEWAEQNVKQPTTTVVQDVGVEAKPTKLPQEPVGEVGAKEPKSHSGIEWADPNKIGVEQGIQFKKTNIVDPVNQVTDALKGVTEYNVDQAGPLTTWVKNNGEEVIAHGHHRLELGKRAIEFIREVPSKLGLKKVSTDRLVPVIRLRESDGWTKEMVRGYAALQNIRDGKGSALDAVDALKELNISSADLVKEGISPRSALYRNINGIMPLKGEALDAVRNGAISESAAAGIGAATDNPRVQLAAVKSVIDSGTQTHDMGYRIAKRTEENLVRATDSGQAELFGGEKWVDTSVTQAKIEDSIIRQATKERQNLSSGIDLKTLDGENINKELRQELADAVGNSGNAVKAKLNAVFEYNQEIRDAIRESATKVANGEWKLSDAVEYTYSSAIERAKQDIATIVRGAEKTSVPTTEGKPRANSGNTVNTNLPKSQAEFDAALSVPEGEGKATKPYNATKKAFSDSPIRSSKPQKAVEGGMFPEAQQSMFGDNGKSAEPFLVELNAGPNIASAVRMADDLTIRPSLRQMESSGTFRVEKPNKIGRDYDLRDDALQPIGIYDPNGNTIQKGSYDRLGIIIDETGNQKNVGTLAGQAIRKAERNLTENMLQAENTLEHINELVQSTVKRKIGKTKQYSEKAFSDFVDLIEKDFDNPERISTKNSDTPIGQALKKHDELTENFRNYIIDSRKQMGIDTPADWGITDKGYFRHLFLGDIRVYKDGDFIGVARTYSEAQKIAMDILKDNPDTNIRAKARNTFGGDPTLRVSTSKYFKLISEIADEVDLSKADIMEDIRGIVGRKASKQKWLGALQKRKGVKGYSKDYYAVMKIHAAQVFRSQELSKLNREVTPMIEELRKYDKPGLAEAIEGHISDLWGTPSKFEIKFGNMLQQTPIIGKYIATPSLAFRHMARTLTNLQFWLKLKGSPRSAIVNLIQPLTTLWPYVSTKDFAALYADYAKPTTRQRLVDRGVLAGSTKIDNANILSIKKRSSAFNPLNWFEKASEVNRGIGYLYGEKLGIKRGMSAEQAHQLGLSWAEKVEFDNSTWNIQPALRSSQGRLFGQFKSFAGKNLENVRDIILAPDIPTPQKIGRIAKWSSAQIPIGGVKSLGVVSKIAGGYLVVQGISNQLQEYGMKKDEADKIATAIYYGAPSLIGQDLSASVAILEEPYGRTTLEKAANFAFGPTVGTAVGVYDAVKSKNYEKAAKSLTPLYKTYDVAKQSINNETSKVKVGNNQYVELSNFEAIMRGLGFTPVKTSEVYDKRDVGIKKSKSSKSNPYKFKPPKY